MAAKHLVRFLDLRYALLLLAFISMTCFAVALGIYDHSGAKYQDYVTDWGDGLAVASVLPSLFWTVSVLLYNQHGVRLRPGWHVGLELVAFIAIASCCGMGVALSQIFTIVTGLRIGGVEDCANWPQQTRCDPSIRGTFGIAIAAYASAFVMAMIHLVYFVIACRTTDLRNRENRRWNKIMRQGGLEAVTIDRAAEGEHIDLCTTSELESPESENFNYDHKFAAEVSSGAVHDCVAEMSSPTCHQRAAELDTTRQEASPHEIASSGRMSGSTLRSVSARSPVALERSSK